MHMMCLGILEVLQSFLTDNNGNGTGHYENGTIKTGKWENGRKKLF